MKNFTIRNKFANERVGMLLASAALLLFSIREVPGQTVLFSGGAGGALPDATAGGQNAGNPAAGIFTSDITVTNAGAVSGFNFITLEDLSHTYMGDLVFTLTHVDTSTCVTFLVRAGKTDASVGYGEGAVFEHAYLTFETDVASTYNSSDSLWRTAAQLGTNVLTGAGTYAATGNSYSGTVTNSYAPSSFNVFAGELAAGTWRLTVRDESTNDTGIFTGWDFQAALVPEPNGNMILMVGGILVVSSFFRWRTRKP